MKPYALSIIEPEDIETYSQVSSIVSNIPELTFPVEDNQDRPVVLSCHILARSCSKFFGLKLVDGHFAPNFQHSWLETSNRHVIDVYPVGICTAKLLIEPILVDRRISTHLYKPNTPGPDQFPTKDKVVHGQDNFLKRIGANESWFVNAVEYVIETLRNQPTTPVVR